MNIFWTYTGLRITYDGDYLTVEDLNPETKIRTRMSRHEIMVIGYKLIWASLFARKRD